MKIPNNNRWTQTNNGDIFGVVDVTRALTYDEPGAVQLPGKPISFYNENENAEFGIPISIQYFSNEYHILTSDDLWVTNTGFANNIPNRISTTPAMDRGGDMIEVFDRLYISGTSALEYFNGSTFTSTGISYSSITYRPLCEFENQNTFKLAVAEDNIVTLYDSSHSSASDVLTLPANLKITTMRYRNGYLYVGTRNMSGGEARVYVWNGNGAAAQYAVPSQSSWVFAMTDYGASVAIVTERGEIRVISGNQSIPFARFPIYYKPGRQWTDSNDTYGKVLNRGIVTDGSRIHLSVYGNNNQDFVEGMFSGVWTYDQEVGLYHRAGVTDIRLATPADNDLTGNTISFSSAHNANTGDSVFVGLSGSITGITAGETYYVIVVDSDSIQFAKSFYDAHNGVPIQLGGTLGSSTFRFPQNQTIGDIYGSEGGAIAMVTPASEPKDIWNAQDIIYGGRTDDGVDTLCLIGRGQSVGAVTTQKIWGARITQTWQAIHAFIRGLYLDVEKVVIKVKTEEKLGLPLLPQRVTWSSATTFTTGDLEEWGAVSVGDEITMLSGYAAGKTAHITAISAGASEYTITVDESIGSNTETTTVTVDNFQKVNVITNTSPNNGYSKETLPAQKSPWLKFKVEFRGYNLGMYFAELQESIDK